MELVLNKKISYFHFDNVKQRFAIQYSNDDGFMGKWIGSNSSDQMRNIKCATEMTKQETNIWNALITKSNPEETLCPYGFFWLANKCYFYPSLVQADINKISTGMSWNKAQLLCEEKGANLVSLNTHDEWLALMNKIRVDALTSSNAMQYIMSYMGLIYIGLRRQVRR